MTPHATNGQQHIELISDGGCNLHICYMISKHFQLQLDDKLPEKEICCSCMSVLSEFHQFYEHIVQTRKHLTLKLPSVDINDSPDAKPGNSFSNEKFAGQLGLGDQFFDAEIKLEVQDLDLLPRIEIIDALPAPDERTERLTRRRLQANADSEKTISKGKCDSSKQSTPSIINHKLTADSDLYDDTKFGEVTISIETLPNVDFQKKKRGRPKKIKVEELTPELGTNGKEEFISTIDYKAQSANNDTSSTDDSIFPTPNNNCSGTDDSANSSCESLGEDNFLSDYNPTPQYAIIPKRKVVKPKKYRKRPKPEVPPKRMSREEIEKRNAQQVEYDEVIRNFFGNFSCPKCKVLVKNFGEIYAHFRVSHSNEIGYMSCCGRKFPQRKALAEHIYVHLNPEHFKCTHCGKVLQDSRNLEAHEETHKNPSEQKPKKVFPCNICEKTYTTKAAYEDHRYAQHMPRSEFKLPCPHCDKMLPTKRRLSSHIKYLHDPESAAVCDKCGKKLRNQTALRKHHKLLHPEVPVQAPEPVQCEICGTWYRHSKGLRQHMRSIHEDSGVEHRCHICNKVSVTANALKHHIYLNHKCERKFKCTMCEKAFKRLQDLREHTSTHTGKVLYTCPNCPMTFFSNANMYKHRQRLHRAQWEADRKKPIPPNIMKKATGATKKSVPHTDTTTLNLFTQKLSNNLFTTEQSSDQTN